jgi:hypothetical protein
MKCSVLRRVGVYYAAWEDAIVMQCVEMWSASWEHYIVTSRHPFLVGCSLDLQPSGHRSER